MKPPALYELILPDGATVPEGDLRCLIFREWSGESKAEQRATLRPVPAAWVPLEFEVWWNSTTYPMFDAGFSFGIAKKAAEDAWRAARLVASGPQEPVEDQSWLANASPEDLADLGQKCRLRPEPPDYSALLDRLPGESVMSGIKRSIAAQAKPEPVPERDERSEFERWKDSGGSWNSIRHDDVYDDPARECEWKGWQARAALDARPTPTLPAATPEAHGQDAATPPR